MRFLTFLCFFHFAGLNNGFTFTAIQPQGFQQMTFAPVLIRGIAGAFNPFRLRRMLWHGGFRGALLRSSRTLQFSSRNAIQKYHPQILLRGLACGVTVNKLLRSGAGSGQAEFGKAAQSVLPTLKSESSLSYRKTDEFEPKKQIWIELMRFNLRAFEKPLDQIRLHCIIESQAFLPPQDQNMIWRHARGGGGDDPAVFTKRGTSH